MKTNVFKLSVLTVACVFAFILNSCSKEELTVVQEADLTTTVDNSQTRAAGPSANGQGTLTLGEISRHFSFQAREKNNGSVQGSGVLTYTAGELKIHFDIDCLSVSGNTATMSGIITKYPQFPDRVGWECWFKVEDNGEGSNSDPDRITLLLTGPDLDDCTVEYGLALNPIEGGNIQVKP
jgi:hypothetical protein